MPTSLVLDGSAVSVFDVVGVARGGRRVELGGGARARVVAARGVIEAHLADGSAHYGINTGFGSLSRVRIASEDLRALQRNLVRSHAAGVGEGLGVDVVRGMMVLLAASLARGMSGVRPVVIEAVLGMLNHGITPVVPSIGSVGASGDLAPLAHVALCLMGEGVCSGPDGTGAAAAVLAKAGLPTIELEAKEGLALINGTHLMAARGALLCADADRLFDAALAATAMSIDASRGTDAFLDARVHAARGQTGQAWVAERLRALLAGSEILPSHREDDPRVQDPYSLRCSPQVLGAAWDCVGYVKRIVEAELGGVTDNPLVFADAQRGTAGEGRAIVSAGNFHGMPLAIPLDSLAIALSHVAGISERRVFWMLSATDRESHLEPYLAAGKPGLNSGLMIAQYTAAACCNELIGLATPASVANLSTSAGIEDYNSFGPRSAAKAARGMELAELVVAIELFCAAEGLERHRPLRSGAGVERAYEVVRSAVPRLIGDRPIGEDIERVAGLVRAGRFSA